MLSQAICRAEARAVRIRAASKTKDVVVVQPSAAGRRRGGWPVWFGFTGGDTADRVAAWIAAGGPGVAELPDELALHRIERPQPAQRRSPAALVR